MTKKHFIALANTIRNNRDAFCLDSLAVLASFCAEQNSRFDRARWLDYIKGSGGPNRRKVKACDTQN